MLSCFNKRFSDNFEFFPHIYPSRLPYIEFGLKCLAAASRRGYRVGFCEKAKKQLPRRYESSPISSEMDALLAKAEHISSADGAPVVTCS